MIVEIEEIYGEKTILINTDKIIMVMPLNKQHGEYQIYMDWSGARIGLNETIVITMTNTRGYNKIKGVKKP